MEPFNHSRIKSDLKVLLKLLRKYKFESENCLELYRIENIIGQCSKATNNRSYKLEELVFNVSNSGMKARPCKKVISVILDTEYVLQDPMTRDNDLFSTYKLELYIKGYNDESDKSKFSFFCWHLDREPNTEGNLIHPYYHFHAGGKNSMDMIWEIYLW